jgi:K+/H+ antiporter YhaU regulatory subunit KhtT
MARIAKVGLGEVALRSRTGATIVAIARDGRLMLNPTTETVFQEGDRIGLIGNPVQLEAAEKLIAAAPDADFSPASNPSEKRDGLSA